MNHSTQSSESVEAPGGSGARPPAVAAETAFKIVGNETRLHILDTLWGASKPGTMAFAELRKAVGIRDGSQFNFHLKKLVAGGFVEKGDGVYTIRQAGSRVICTIRAGYFTDHPEIDAFETTGRCYACDAPLQARYADGMFFVACCGCDQLHAGHPFPPAGLRGRTPAEALAASDRTTRAAVGLAHAGICPICNAPTERTVSRVAAEIPVQSANFEWDTDGGVIAWHVCTHCNAWVSIAAGDAVHDHPAVIELYRDRGVDLREVPRWERPWAVDPSAVEVVSDDPLRVRLTVAFRGETRVLTLDEAFDVVAVE